ncbi:MAG: zinc dependent phospholipase C family protein [Agarilytica sp.]
MNFKVLVAISMSVLMLMAQGANAFKYKTHVWISQQVIDDLEDDGNITIEIGGVSYEYPVDGATRDAILNNRSVYRMGNIGPDVAPDVVTGQFLIHPGTDDYGTDVWAQNLENYIREISSRVTDEDWYAYEQNVCEQRDYDLDKLWSFIESFGGDDDESSASGDYLGYANDSGLLDSLEGEISAAPMDGPKHQSEVNSEEIAYHKGFLGHLAGDTFAHSYVNHYAGDVFWLADGELDVEKRHAAIESYIDANLPGLPQGKPYDLIKSPSEFLANAFIFNTQTAFDVATSDPQFPLAHFYAIERLRAAIRKTAASCVWTGIERFAGQVVISEMTGYTPSESQIQAVNDVIDDANQLNSDFLEGLNELQHKLDDEIRGQFLEHSDNLLSAFDETTNAVDTFLEIETEINGYNDRLENEIVGTLCGYERKIERRICDSQPWPLDDICDDVTETIRGPSCSTHSVYLETVRLRDDLLAARNDDLDSMLRDIRENAVKLRDSMVAIHDAKVSIENLITYIATFPLDSVDPFRNALKRWDQNITEAMVAWVEANAEGARLSMIAAEQPVKAIDEECFKLGSGIGDCLSREEPVLDPLLEWTGIHGPALIGVPSELTTAMRDVGAAFSSIRSVVDGSARTAFNASSDPFSRFMLTMVEKNISQELSGTDVVEEVISFVGDEDDVQMYRDALAVFAVRIDEDTINSQFSIDESGKGLVRTENFVHQLKNDMGLYGSDTIDIENFSALKNALTLTKMTLLSDTQLNAIANVAGINLSGNEYTNGNIIYGAIKSIDGHQQWRPYANDLPRREGFPFDQHSKAFEAPYFNSFGYDIGGGDSGFRFWQGNDLGNDFNKLFEMPLHNEAGMSPGVLVVIINSILLH